MHEAALEGSGIRRTRFPAPAPEVAGLDHRHAAAVCPGHNTEVKLLTVAFVPLVVVTVLLTGLKTCPARDGVTV